MQKLALGVAALLVTAGGSVATAAPGSNADGGEWCERHSDAGARPEVEKEKPVAAGGGSRDGKQKNAFACYGASTRAADRDVYAGAVVNAWFDYENGNVRLNCVPQQGSMVDRRCNRTVLLPARAAADAPDVDAQAPTRSQPGRVAVGDDDATPTLAVDAGDVEASVDLLSTCVEVDRTPICRENVGGE